MRKTFSVLLLLALAALAVGLAAHSARAAAPAAQVTDSTAESKFPEGMRFTVQIDNPSAVKSLRVLFRVVGGRLPRYEYLPLPDASGKAGVLVRTDTGDRYVPPGVVVEYSFEITDQQGNVTATESKRFVFDDVKFQWQEVSNPRVTIRYYGPITRRAETVRDAVDDTMQRIGYGLFGLKQIDPVRLTLYNNWADMSRALPPSSSVQREQLITEGLSFSNFGVILLLASDNTVRGLASHEMVHYLVEQALGGFNALLPVWINEGLAEYGNVEPSQVYEQYLTLAIVRGTLKPLTSLSQMPGKSEDVITVYGQGRSLIEFLIEDQPDGAAKLRQTFAALRQGRSIDDALMAAYGMDRFSIDQAWRKKLGITPLSADTRQSPIPQAERPTVAPLPFPASSSGQSSTAQPTPQPAPAQQESAAPAQPKSNVSATGCSKSNAAAKELGMWLGLGALAMVITVRRWRNS
jgi:hypothetical protein